MLTSLIILGLAISFFTAFLLIPIAIRLGHKYNLLDIPGEHKRHKKPTPILGGIVLFASTWTTILFIKFIYPQAFAELSASIFYILGGSLIITLVGFSDDLSPLSAWFKLLAQTAAALLLYWGGIQFELINTPFGVLEVGNYSLIITIIWVLAITNAINLIDGLDGLASGVSLIGAVSLLIIGILHNLGINIIFLLTLIGFLSVFLFYNKYPAKIFLGDSGSMQIGYYFAVFSLTFPLKSYATAALYVPLLVLGVPLIEMISSFVRRLISGKNIMKADRRHLFHYLSLLGLSPHKILVVFYGLGIIYGLCTIAMFFWDRALVFSFLVIFMVVIFVVFFILIFKQFPRKISNGKKN